MSLKCHHKYPPKKEQKKITQTHVGEVHVKTEAEISMMGPQAKECLEPPEGGSGKKEIL